MKHVAEVVFSHLEELIQRINAAEFLYGSIDEEELLDERVVNPMDHRIAHGLELRPSALRYSALSA